MNRCSLWIITGGLASGASNLGGRLIVWPHDENPTYRAESAERTSNETVVSSLCHFPTGARRRSSSKKFSRNVTRTGALSAAIDSGIGNTAKRFPSGCRARFSAPG